MSTLLVAVRIAIIVYLFVAPFIFIYLQQSLFKASFDDELGTKLITRLYLITAMSCAMVFLMTLTWEACDFNGWTDQCFFIPK